MSIIALLDIQLNPEDLPRARDAVHETLKVTRDFAGCEGIDVMVDETDPAHLVVVERWVSPEADAAYREFRSTPAGASPLGQYLATRPTLTKGLLDPDV